MKMNRRDFVTGLLGVSVTGAVLAKTDALPLKKPYSAPTLTHNGTPTKLGGDYGASMYEREYVRMHQEALSRQLAKQIDDQVFKRYTR